LASSVIASNAIWLSVWAMLSSNDIEAIARMAYLPRRIAVGDLSTMRLRPDDRNEAVKSKPGTVRLIRWLAWGDPQG